MFWCLGKVKSKDELLAALKNLKKDTNKIKQEINAFYSRKNLNVVIIFYSTILNKHNLLNWPHHLAHSQKRPKKEKFLKWFLGVFIAWNIR